MGSAYHLLMMSSLFMKLLVYFFSLPHFSIENKYHLGFPLSSQFYFIWSRHSSFHIHLSPLCLSHLYFQAFGTGSDDSTCRFFDIRSCGEVSEFKNDMVGYAKRYWIDRESFKHHLSNYVRFRQIIIITITIPVIIIITITITVIIIITITITVIIIITITITVIIIIIVIIIRIILWIYS